MRTCLALALLASSLGPVLAAPAAPTDEVIVTGAKSLRGIWKITLPGGAEPRHRADVNSGAVGTFSDDESVLQDHALRFASSRQQLCRIGGDEKLAVRCISFGKAGDGLVVFHGDQLSLSWSGDKGVRMVLRGRLQSEDHFAATFVMEHERERQSNPEPMAGEKVNLAATRDEAGLGFVLQGTLAGLALGDAALLKLDAPDVAVPPDLAAMGRIQALYYIGQAPLMRDPQARPALEVYAVEFANGERLCGFHMAHGKVDGLRCV